MPANAHISIASEIILNPIVSHHTRKNGFSALSITPVSNGPCFGVDTLDSFFLNVVLICMNAKINRATAPKIEIISLNSGNNSKEKTPIPSKITNGNSTIVWPIAIFKPALVPSLSPHDTFAVNRGPGAMTPDVEMPMTSNANSRI